MSKLVAIFTLLSVFVSSQTLYAVEQPAERSACERKTENLVAAVVMATKDSLLESEAIRKFPRETQILNSLKNSKEISWRIVDNLRHMAMTSCIQEGISQVIGQKQ